ncbi:hypothetical protein H4219_006408 [Mycoemilia scoparia]|uniref:Reverse transcriptase domain-containing protein n=1 Tax=Mycoemilia scoparia TaxID=417184 RepID=A0A9W7ZJX2_9FUNG|nr:hypothetical protein H4219_006408 [Mycoemilia scoparia]
MDDTAVCLSSMRYFPLLKSALDDYCVGSNAAFNINKTELLLVGEHPDSDISQSGITPIPDGKPIRYLGGYIGNKVDWPALARSFLDEVYQHAVKVAPLGASPASRACIIATYSISKLVYVSHLIPFENALLQDTDSKIQKLLWDRSKPWLNKDILSLPTRGGGFSLPCLHHIVLSGQIQFAHRFCILAAASAVPGSSPSPSPFWFHALMFCWLSDVCRPGSTAPLFLKQCPAISKAALLNPFVQSIDGCHIRPLTWPPALFEAFKVVAHKGCLSSALSALAPSSTSSTSAPLLGLALPNLRGPDWCSLLSAARFLPEVLPPLTVDSSSIVSGALRASGGHKASLLAEFVDATVDILAPHAADYSRGSYTDHLLINNNGTTLPFRNWASTHAARKAILGPITAPKAPLVRLPACLRPSSSSRCSDRSPLASLLWSACQALQILSQARATLFRMLHGHVPFRLDSSRSCPCSPGSLETADYCMNQCVFHKPFRTAIFAAWFRIAKAIRPLCCDLLGIPLNTVPPLPDIASLLEPLAGELIPSPDPPIWRVAPASSWSCLPSSVSPLAKSFQALWTLGSAAVAHLQWMSRNDLAYRGCRWSTECLLSTYTNYLRQFAHVLVPDRDTRRFLLGCLFHLLPLAPASGDSPSSLESPPQVSSPPALAHAPQSSAPAVDLGHRPP